MSIRKVSWRVHEHGKRKEQKNKNKAQVRMVVREKCRAEW